MQDDLERIRAVQKRGHLTDFETLNLHALISSRAVAARYLEQSGMKPLNHTLSYRYGGAVEMDPILKLGALQS